MKSFKDDIDEFTAKWDKAIEDGVFKDDTTEFVPSKQTSGSSFFGASDTNPSDEIAPEDSSYWGMVHQRAEYPAGFSHAPTDKQEIISEVKKPLPDLKDITKKVAASPNPVRQGSTKNDQDMSDRTLGKTYKDEDIDEITELKTKLHDLENKLNSLEGLGKSGKNVDAQIKALKEKIDDLSDALGHGDEISQQGD